MELVKTVKMIYGEVENLQGVCFLRHESLETLKERINNVIKQMKDADRIIFLVDMFGGSCAKTCCDFLELKEYEILSGVNLPMILELISKREQASSLKEAVELAKAAGTKGIISLKGFFRI
ncbi:MAG: hypothetical protein A2X49_07830 [Lentisphaerae bacterium GWF2_52_8]|nr:MAG: hypothetical protein A2X49_07830 [Lentisphaerae bacterium GWF2_52_8]